MPREGTKISHISYSRAISSLENVTGSRFDDRIAGNSGANSLTGGLGADLFLFATGSGNDRITDCSAAPNDRIDVSAYDAEGTATITQHGSDAWIDLGSGNVIVVANTTATDSSFLSHIVW